MAQHTTNYYNTFIAVADDCPAVTGEVPPVKNEKRTIANFEFELIRHNPYRYTSDDIRFEVYAERNAVAPGERDAARNAFFSKGQPCFRASPLAKRYGWGIHSDDAGKIALYGRETSEYESFLEDSRIHVIKAMRSSR